MRKLVIVTWNLQGRDPSRLDFRPALAEWRPDVVLLQECDANKISEVLPPSFEPRQWWPGAGTRPGIMLASHLPLEDSGVLDPIDPPWDRPRVCWARFRTPVGPLTVAAVHLLAPLLPGARSRRDAQREELTTWSEALMATGARLVVGRDFNTQDPHLRRMTDACGDRAMATWRPMAATWMQPMLRLDAVFVSPTIRVLAGGVDDRWRGSDHLPVVAHIQW